MIKTKRMSAFINGSPIGLVTSFDLASQPDYSVESLYFKGGGSIVFIRTLEQRRQMFQKYNRQLLPGTYISTLSP